MQTNKIVIIFCKENLMFQKWIGWDLFFVVFFLPLEKRSPSISMALSNGAKLISGDDNVE